MVSETLSNNQLHERAFLVYTFVSRELVHRTQLVTSQEAYERCADFSIDVHNTCVNDLLECLRIITSHLRASVQLSEDALKTLLPVIKVPAPKSTAMVHCLHGRRVSDLGSHNLTNILGDAETTTGILKHLAQRATSICDPPDLKRKAYVCTAVKNLFTYCASHSAKVRIDSTQSLATRYARGVLLLGLTSRQLQIVGRMRVLHIFWQCRIPI